MTPPDTKMNSLFSIFVSWFPMLLLIGVWVFFMRQMQGGSKGMGFGKSKAKLISDKSKSVISDCPISAPFISTSTILALTTKLKILF